MTTPTAPAIDCEQHHPGLSVSDVRAATDFYTRKLGFTMGFTWGEPPTIAGVQLGKVQIFLEQGTPCPKGVRFISSSAMLTSFMSSTALTALMSWSRLGTGTMACATTQSRTCMGTGCHLAIPCSTSARH